MSWTVAVYDPLYETLVTSATNGVVGGQVAIRKFDPPVVIPPGSGKVLNLYVKQSIMQVPPRGIVRFGVGSTPVFWGPAVIVPAPSAVGAGPFDQDRDALERVTVLGGEQLLRDTVIGPLLVEVVTDVAEIAFALCTLYAHPALTVSDGNFSVAGAVLNAYYAPEKTLYDALMGLAEAVPGGASCWVDASGAVRFEAIP